MNKYRFGKSQVVNSDTIRKKEIVYYVPTLMDYLILIALLQRQPHSRNNSCPIFNRIFIVR